MTSRMCRQIGPPRVACRYLSMTLIVQALLLHVQVLEFVRLDNLAWSHRCVWQSPRLLQQF